MTADELSSMTLADLEAAAARAESAAKTLRDALSLLGAGPTSRAVPSIAAPPPAPRVDLLPEEQAKKEALMAQFKAGLPAEIQAAEAQPMVRR